MPYQRAESPPSPIEGTRIDEYALKPRLRAHRPTTWPGRRVHIATALLAVAPHARAGVSLTESHGIRAPGSRIGAAGDRVTLGGCGWFRGSRQRARADLALVAITYAARTG